MSRRPSMLLLAIAMTPLLAAASSGDRAPRVALLPRYEQECVACHLAYPPGLLPASSWQRLLDNLPRHYGTDASLDAATVAELSQWLGANAAAGAVAAPPDDRITRSRWFVREHREVPPDAWRRASVRSAANCAACHRGAAHGDFDEDSVRIPR